LNEQRISEDLLRARTQSILETAVDAIITIDERGIVDSFNPAAERIFGFRADEVLGRNVSMLMPPPDSSRHDRYIAEYLRTGEKKIIGIGREVIGLRKDGTRFPIELAVSEVKLGERRFFMGIVRDITKLRNAQDKLVQSERLAAIGEMMAGLAHESRNALQRTRACLDMLELDLDGQSDALDLIRRGQTALDELHRLYEEVRGYAAPVTLELSDCDLSHVWETAWGHLADQRQNRTVGFSAGANGVELRCRIDPHRIGQVLRNLLENALAAVADPGEIALECADAHISGRAAVRILLRDNGPGFTPVQQKKAFEPFFTTKARGTGLGMAIAKRIVEEHGGTITAGNAPGRGAEIRITLPRTASRVG
jgi:hypothetical protein